MPHAGTDLSAATNRIGNAGFVLSLFGFCGVWLVSAAAAGLFGQFDESIYLIGVALTFLSLPGILLSAFGLRRSPCRLAAWGLVIGIIAAMYLPTFCSPLYWRYAAGR
jgi:hypothetical protein